MTRRLAILQQFDPAGGVPHYIRAHLEGLRPVAERIVLVSNSPVAAEDRAVAEAICDAVIERPNTGWDFAGWRDALALEDMAQWDEVILTNSSVIGPLFPLASIFAEMDTRREKEAFDFWGMVFSRQIRHHLQSYFFVFSAPVIRSDAWRSFWRGVADIDDKDEVIARYEAGITVALASGGFSYAAYMPDPPLARRIRICDWEVLGKRIHIPFDCTRVNRTVRWHDELVEQGFPYLKASLLWGKDTWRLKDFDRIRDLTAGTFDWSAIERDMQK
ncbi:rhamnan synthesis F family protein [Alteraurantiacibacter aquimixticola]|nr:rhamnan synthesis F family protein [Alteraurantiacibacter aquimixticola]